MLESRKSYIRPLEGVLVQHYVDNFYYSVLQGLFALFEGIEQDMQGHAAEDS